MANVAGSGFREIAHTADWALEVWAPDLDRLFDQAARGMYWLMATRLQPAPRIERALSLEGQDAESLLVSFLSELLYLGEIEGLGFDQFQVRVQADRLDAVIRGAPIARLEKEIKAVTFHNLAVTHEGHQLKVTIIFDV